MAVGASFLLALALGAQPAATLHPAETLAVQDRRVRLGDLASVSGTQGARELENRVVAMFPSTRRSVTLSRAALVALVRHTVPGLSVRGGPASLVLQRDMEPQPAFSAQRCFALASSLAAGAIVRSSDLIQADCADAENAPIAIRFDRRGGAARAAAALPAGTYLGRVSLPDEVAVERGQALTIVSSVGPVRIERPVTALQSGRSGGSAFVRDAEGQVFAAPIQTTAEERPLRQVLAPSASRRFPLRRMRKISIEAQAGRR